ncbi:hypothetical protein BYT27DRAFT_7213787 [Phlegmacium glaucopus]|nr:hypothetical protein BYT27DRAFT_7213787 [Phlegmacium glaucopus]
MSLLDLRKPIVDYIFQPSGHSKDVLLLSRRAFANLIDLIKLRIRQMTSWLSAGGSRFKDLREMDKWRVAFLGDGGVGNTALAVQYLQFTLNSFVACGGQSNVSSWGVEDMAKDVVVEFVPVLIDPIEQHSIAFSALVQQPLSLNPGHSSLLSANSVDKEEFDFNEADAIPITASPVAGALGHL